MGAFLDADQTGESAPFPPLFFARRARLTLPPPPLPPLPPAVSLPPQVNYNLMSVNFFMGLTGLYQLYRLATHERQQVALAEAEISKPPPSRSQDQQLKD